MELSKSFRGSSSDQATKYKKKGHKDEELFSALIKGQVISGTGKADVIDSNKHTYSVKGGAKKWQIFLYGENRFIEDKGFHFSNIGNFFLDSLNSFPKEYSLYKSDKEKAKKKLLDFYELNNKKPILVEDYLQVIGNSNQYLNSKILLMEVNKKIKEVLSEKDNLKKFLMKSIFDGENVDFWSIKDNELFLVFDREEAVEVLSSSLTADLSKQTTGRQDDITLAGQKVLLKSKNNVVEIEVRNDSDKHYRQIRFNMIREKTIDILKRYFNEKKIFNDKVRFYKRIS